MEVRQRASSSPRKSYAKVYLCLDQQVDQSFVSLWVASRGSCFLKIITNEKTSSWDAELSDIYLYVWETELLSCLPPQPRPSWASARPFRHVSLKQLGRSLAVL